MAAVFDFNDGDNDERRERVGLLGLLSIVVDRGKRTFPSLTLDAFIVTVVTFLFFFEGFVGDTIAFDVCVYHACFVA